MPVREPEVREVLPSPEESTGFSRELGGWLRFARLQRGLSLNEVQERSGGRLPAGTMSSYERGVRKIKAETLAEVAAFYGVEPVSLIPESR